MRHPLFLKQTPTPECCLEIISQGTSWRLYSWGHLLRKHYYNSIITITPEEGQLFVDVHVFGVFNISRSLGSVGELRWGSSELSYWLVVILHRRWNQDPRLRRWRQYCLAQQLWVMCKKALCSDALFNEKLLPFDFLSPSYCHGRRDISSNIFSSISDKSKSIRLWVAAMDLV